MPVTIRKSPTWMQLLPSNVNEDIRPPRHSVLQRRPSFPYIEHTRLSTPFITPPEYPKSEAMQAVDLSRALGPITDQQPSLPRMRQVRAMLAPVAEHKSRPKRRCRPIAVPTLSPMLEAATPAVSQPFTAPPVMLTSALPPTPPTTPPPILTRSTSVRNIAPEKHDVEDFVQQTQALRRRLSKSVKPKQATSSPINVAASLAADQQPSGEKPAFVKELSSFLTSRSGK